MIAQRLAGLQAVAVHLGHRLGQRLFLFKDFAKPGLGVAHAHHADQGRSHEHARRHQGEDQQSFGEVHHRCS
jgi:hypothetical protein